MQQPATTGALDIEAADQAVGVRPETAMRLMQLAGDAAATAHQVTEIIDADPSMTMRTLKLANSALYGMPHRVSRVDRAVTMLGIATIAKLAASSSVESAFRNVTIDAPGITPDTAWRYSLSVALATEAVAAECPNAASVGMRRLGAEAFVTGLIHDIGTIVQARLAREAFTTAVNASLKTGISLVTQERRLIGIDHAEIGRRLAEHWSLPDSLVSGIGFHHDPLSAESDHRPLACLVHAAAQLVRRAGIPSYDGDADTPDLEKAMTCLRIDPRRIDKIVGAVRKRVQAAAF